MIQIVPIPLLKDNYAFALLNGDVAAVVDPSEAKPVLEFFEKQGKKITHILSTHHHWDHVGGNEEIKAVTGCQIIGGDDRVTGLDIKVVDGQTLMLGETEIRILGIPGHTLGHTAYFLPKNHALFSGDTLFSLGCGRLFEGTPEQMFSSLAKIKKLPPETSVYCGHEYTEANARFAMVLDPANRMLEQYAARVREMRQTGKPTVPASLANELRLNPFLLARDAAAFAELRRLKDKF